MLMMKDIRQYLSDLGIAQDDNVYIGKMDSKKQTSIGVYGRKSNGQPFTAAGGLECTTYATKPVSLLIHWNKSQSETEKVASELFEKLNKETSLTIGETLIHVLRLAVPEPQDVGTDESGVYEYVIWLDFIYERNR